MYLLCSHRSFVALSSYFVTGIDDVEFALVETCTPHYAHQRKYSNAVPLRIASRAASMDI
jgi:hypothetical protein